MNKNNAIAKIDIAHNRSVITDVIGIIPECLGNITDWIAGRTSPIGRDNINYLLKIAGIRNNEEYLKVTYGISLTDTFWFKQPDDKMTWEKISPYKNRLSRVISEVCLNGEYRYHGELRSPSPDYKLDGSVEKCWKRVDGDIYLYKTTGECWSGVAGLRTYMEYYASQVAEQLITDKRHFVKYGIKVSKTDKGYRKPYAYCKSFTSEKHGLLQYGVSRYRNIELPELDRSILDDRSRIILREMLMLDSIILNYDRHDLNYGFFIDNDTYRIEGLTPIYDNDCSMGHFISLQSVDSAREAYNEALRKQPRTEMGDYIEQAKWAMTSELYQNMRNMYPFHFKRLPEELDVETNRIKFMEYIINMQIKNIISSIKR